jgi:hypothetical protein
VVPGAEQAVKERRAALQDGERPAAYRSSVNADGGSSDAGADEPHLRSPAHTAAVHAQAGDAEALGRRRPPSGRSY